MNKKVLFSILSGILVLPSLASAQTLESMADAAVHVALYVVSAIVVIMWLVTGVLFLSAQGDPSKLKAAKTALFAAIAGTILVIVASGAIGLVSSTFGI